MKPLLRTFKLAMATMALALGGLTIAGSAMPAAHAAFREINPTIQTNVYYYGSPPEATLYVRGAGFNPGGSVLVEEYNSARHLVYSRYLTASPFCHLVDRVISCNGGGTFSTYFRFYHRYPTARPYYYIAFDYSSHRWSNWSSQYII